jgi:hypothetical protein
MREGEDREGSVEVLQDTTFGEGGKKYLFYRFEGSQVVLARPSGRGTFEKRQVFANKKVIF